jgi:23S rRNA (adenine2503-C2)-methyltransferase
MSAVELLDRLPDELEDLAESLGAPRYRGRQIATWLYKKGVTDPRAMSDLPRAFREILAERARATLPAVERTVAAQDGSKKLVLLYADGARVHAVVMPDEDRLTLCLSAQVGCGFGCAFCLTATMGHQRNLTTGEIMGQVLAATASLEAGQRLTHVVYMGMGEPLANYAATVRSLRLLTDPRAFGLSPRRVTVSTVGLAGAIERLAREDLKVNLAVSLHAATDEVRGRLMPVNRSFPIGPLLEACRRFPVPVRRRLTIEYVLLDGVNDSPEDAK